MVPLLPVRTNSWTNNWFASILRCHDSCDVIMMAVLGIFVTYLPSRSGQGWPWKRLSRPSGDVNGFTVTCHWQEAGVFVTQGSALTDASSCKSVSQWRHSFQLKAVPPLANRLATASWCVCSTAGRLLDGILEFHDGVISWNAEHTASCVAQHGTLILLICTLTLACMIFVLPLRFLSPSLETIDHCLQWTC